VSSFVRAPWSQPISVSSVLVTGPTEEPITLDQAKLAAGLDWPSGDPRDAQMQGFIAAARQQVELDTGLALLTQTRDVTIEASAAYGWVIPMPSQAMPVQTISGPTALDLNRAVRQTSDGWWLAVPTGTWRIVAGWPDRTALQAEAPLLVHAVTLLTAHYATIGRDLTAMRGDGFGVTPMGYAEAIQPYRLVVLP
jgi:hypothetical protein